MPGLEVAEQPEDPTGTRFVITDSGSAGGGRGSRPGGSSGANFAHKAPDENPGRFATASPTPCPPDSQKAHQNAESGPSCGQQWPGYPGPETCLAPILFI